MKFNGQIFNCKCTLYHSSQITYCRVIVSAIADVACCGIFESQEIRSSAGSAKSQSWLHIPAFYSPGMTPAEPGEQLLLCLGIPHRLSSLGKKSDNAALRPHV